MPSCRPLMCLLAAAVVVAPAQATEGPDETFFRERVEPLLVRRCLDCHATAKRGGLDLRSAAGALAGGDSGVVLVPGNSAESLLYEYVSTEYMPPEEPLPADEVAVLREWIDRGAYFPERALDPYAFSTEKRAGYDWWSLQPVASPAPPDVAEPGQLAAGRVQNPIDAFVLARLGRSGLSFSPPADRATYLRRITFDLHGLPPTYEQMQEFVGDARPDAYERLVDRLLASPRYGERWGRHWLDVVRFAESNGFERDRLRENFWRYRDWVIDAFNRDLPYDQFVREQLAGDALRPNDPQALVATGFLAAGPKNDVATISELEQLMTRQDELDEYVVATGATFLGLTIGCARCHDHKFDPILARDYYSLTAVFSGLDRGDNVVAPLEEQTRHAAAVKTVQDQIDRIQATQRELLAPIRQRLLAELNAADSKADDADKWPMVAPRRNEDTFAPLPARYVRFTVAATLGDTQPCLDELEIYGADESQNLALASAGAIATASSLLPGYPIHQIEHLNDGQYGNAWSWISNEPGRGWAQIELPETATIERVVWGRDREGAYTDRLATNYRIEVSEDQQTWTIVSSSQLRARFRPGATEADQVPLDQVLAALPADQRGDYDRLAAELAEAEARLRQIPPLPVSYSARDNPPRDAFVLVRGNVRERAEPVQPAALRAIAGIEPSLLPDTDNSGPERRRRLAEWIVDARHPLTARVFVNRVWHYHFGQGIVGTPSDFGFNGDRPSHSELLDWLASDFTAGGWRLKRLHKLIVLSDAYRQSSGHNEQAAAIDGNNHLLWRMNPQRLESESLRDAVLHTSGKLDLALGGPSFRLFEYRDGNVPDYLLVENSGPDTWRRAVYMFNIRTFHEPLMTVFDCPDPSVATPRRDRSTTALQALSLMNNAFVFDQARHFAERIQRAVGLDATPQSKAVQAYRYALARDPTEAETETGAEFVAQHGLLSLCRVLLNTNEFLYVR